MPRLIAPLVIGLLANAASAATLLYDDTFEAGEASSYTTVFGSPEQVGTPNLFGSGALKLNNRGNYPLYYEQIRYSIGSQGAPWEGLEFSRFDISFDFYTESFIGNTQYDPLFAIFFDDYGTLNRMTLEQTGLMNVDNYALSQRTVITGFQNSRIERFDVSYDLDNLSWGIWINDHHIWTGALAAGTRLRDVRFSFTGPYPNAYTGNFTHVFLDSIAISGVIVTPLPATIWALGSALCVLAGLGRRVIGSPG